MEFIAAALSMGMRVVSIMRVAPRNLEISLRNEEVPLRRHKSIRSKAHGFGWAKDPRVRKVSRLRRQWRNANVDGFSQQQPVPKLQLVSTTRHEAPDHNHACTATNFSACMSEARLSKQSFGPPALPPNSGGKATPGASPGLEEV